MKFFKILILSLLVCACKNEPKQETIPSQKTEQLELKYAKGFKVDYHENFTVLSITNPWPKSEKTFRYVLISQENMAKTAFAKDAYDGIIVNPIERIVVTSTTHIPALELLNVEEALIGFPETNYISSEKTRIRIDNGAVRELGKNEGLNTEVLLDINPNVVIGHGLDGTNKTFETIKKVGIPVIYNGDWVEGSALAKAEWIKFFAVLFQKEKEADSIFNQIETDYLKAKAMAQNAKNRPTVLSGAMHKDVWYLPNGSSPEAQFLKDANLDYLWSETTGNGSLALSFETVLTKAKAADVWISPSYYTSFEKLEKANTLYTNFDAFKNKNIYTFANTTGETGGVLYYELGTARPDLVLKDLIKIAHPELLEGYEPYFFEKLN
ncbi:iron complex transport system substrate-binding protein [Winogradskyella epiphytica]|uniref:Iron complex transport system substrate-binding protein n=1 Tax=Winogradskyella epiphytica TaxID=262005 RepID=A0A2V4XEV4_9FLAO|nr:ABC transporter substrate-binding protein [Winogradskyella epiphytica]PYE81114.1 iron complex transport system substrate-binding protein [Winogradskyella epiphytica]GGW66958.1 ABC transporter substrate-binding protein [Winogradskyella epiphytica]